jgi:hypothetical protein
VSRLLTRPYVERVELGWKERGGSVTSRLAVKAYVSEKTDDLDPAHRLPHSTRILLPVGRGLYRSARVPTDVVWHAPARFVATPGDLLDPVPGGAMIGVSPERAGTYTCTVRDAAGALFGLTAGHVIQPFQGVIGAGRVVLQPPDPGAPVPAGATEVIGETRGGFFGNTPAGFLDFAVLRLDPHRACVSDPFDGAPLRRQVLPESVVMSGPTPATKFGAFTGRTHGVFSTRITAKVIEGVQVTNVLEFKGTSGPTFGSHGDSGALVVSEAPASAGMVIGILIAVMPPTPDAPAGRGYVMPFQRLSGLRLV